MREFVMLGAAGLGLGMMVVSPARGNLLINGGLEKDATTPLNIYNLLTVGAHINSTALPGWSITSGTVDLVPTSYFQSSGGGFSVDMVGTPGLGIMRQTVTTTAGVNYTLKFDLAANPEAGPFFETGTIKVLRVQALAANGTTVLGTQDFQVGDGTRSNQDMQYASNSFNFKATGARSTIQLRALAPLNLPPGITIAIARTGPVVDNLDLDVSAAVTPFPEPASLGMLLPGALALLVRRRARCGR